MDVSEIKSMIPLPAEVAFLPYVSLIFSTTSILFLSVIIYAMTSQSKKTPQNTLITILCLSDLVYAVLVFCLVVSVFKEGGFVWGQVGCLVMAPIVLLSAGLSIFALFLVALDRLLRVIMLKKSKSGGFSGVSEIVSIKTYLAVIVVVIFFFALMLCAPFYVPSLRNVNSYELSPCFLYCDWKWSNSEDPFPRMVSAIAICLLIGSASVMIGSYVYIVKFYRDFEKSNQFSANPHQVRASSSTSPPHAAPAKSSSAFRKPSQIQTNRDMAVASIDRGAASESSETGAVVSPSSSPPASLRLQSVASSMRPSVRGTGLTMEQRITLNGIAVTLCFLTCWTPFCIRILIEMTTNKTVSPAFDAFSAMCATANGVLNPIVMYFFDSNTRNIINKRIFKLK